MDSAHTGLSSASLVTTLQAIFPHRPAVALVVAMASDKDCHAIVQALGNLAPQLVVCVAPAEGWLSGRGLPAEVVASAFESMQRESCVGASAPAARICTAESMSCAHQIVMQWLERINGLRQHHPSSIEESNVPEVELDPRKGPSVVCVTGSNYVVGSASELFV